MEVATPSSAIVPEVLNENNYERWSIFMKHYLVGQDLWNVVQLDQKPEEVKARIWIKKNALALHAIKISCGVKAFDRIKKIESAKCAWDVLALLVNVQKSPVVSLNIGELHEVINPNVVELYKRGPDTLEMERRNLLNSIYTGSFWHAKLFLLNNRHEISARILENGYTVLHVAISVGNQWFVEELITMASVEDLEKQDNSGNTALSLAARNGMMTIAKCLIGKNEKLLTISDANGKIPVTLACEAGHEDMTRYLYHETPLKVLEGDNSFYLLQECITKKMFDIAYDLVTFAPGLTFRCPSSSNPIILTLARTPPPFFRESQLGFWGHLLYNSIRAKPDVLSLGRDIRRHRQSCTEKILDFYESCAEKTGDFYESCAEKIEDFYQSCAGEIQQARAIILDLEWPKLCGILLLGLIFFPFILLGGVLFIISLAIVCMSLLIANAKSRLISLASLILGTLVSVLTRFFAKHIYSLKVMDVYARELIWHICYYELLALDYNEFVQSGVVEATFQAIKNGIPEIVARIVQANPDIIWSGTDPENSRNMFACAVSHRQENLALLFYEFGARNGTNIAFGIDKDGNNTLHIAAKLAPDSQLRCISNTAMLLQSEVRWFKSVEGVVPRFYNEQKNKDDETPSQLFINEHENLLREAQEWIKKTAESSTTVGALIITIMFTAAFTVPGGNNTAGFPMFLSKKPVPFMIFIVSDVVSFFSASIAVLMFLMILTSSYAYEDFLKSLPRKLIIGISWLFISIATMMVAFCAALFIMLRGQLSVLIPITLLAGIPVIFFALLQSPLFIKIYVSTFSSDIFDRKRMKNLSKRSEFDTGLDRFRFSNYLFKYLPGLMLRALWKIFCVCE